jgi:hypothetical protein
MLPSLVSLRSGGFGVASVGAIKHLSEGRSQYVLTAEELQLIIDKFPKPLHGKKMCVIHDHFLSRSSRSAGVAFPQYEIVITQGFAFDIALENCECSKKERTDVRLLDKLPTEAVLKIVYSDASKDITLVFHNGITSDVHATKQIARFVLRTERKYYVVNLLHQKPGVILYEIAHDNTNINLQRAPTPEVIYPYLFHDEYPSEFENGFSVTQIQFYPPWQFVRIKVGQLRSTNASFARSCVQSEPLSKIEM